MSNIRALIVEYAANSQPPIVTVSTDREQIGKAIRQGGRAVWLDVAEADPVAEGRDWLAAALHIPRVTFERTPPFCNQAPLLTLGLPTAAINRRDVNRSITLHSTWIVMRDGLLLTVHPTAYTDWDAIFEAARTQTPAWQQDFSSTLYLLLKALVDATEQTLDFSSSQYQAIRADVFREQDNPNYADMAIPLYRWQLGLAATQEQLAGAPAALRALYTALVADGDVADRPALGPRWPFMALATRLETAYTTLAQAFADADRLARLLTILPSGQQTKTTTTLISEFRALDVRLQRLIGIGWTAIALLLGILATGALLVLRGR